MPESKRFAPPVQLLGTGLPLQITMELGVQGTVFLAAFLTMALYAFMWWCKVRKRMPPGPLPLPILGNMLHVGSSNMPGSLIMMSRTYGPVFTLYMFNGPTVILIGFDNVRAALRDRGEVFNRREHSALHQLLFKGCGVLLSNGECWRQLHLFAVGFLKHADLGNRSMEMCIKDESRHLIEEIRKKGRDPFDPTPLLSKAVANVIYSAVFGDRCDYEDVKFMTFLGLLKEMTQLMSSTWGMLLNHFPNAFSRIPGPHQKIFTNFEKLRDFVAESVEEHKASFNPDLPRDFIDHFLKRMAMDTDKSKSHYHFDTLFGSIIDYFIAGTDTTSATLKCGLLYLLKYPYVQSKIHVELDHVIGKNRCPSMEDRVQMPYTDAVVHETQRFADVAPLAISHVASENTTFRRYNIPKDTVIVPVLTSVLRDPRYFKNPRQFDPTNFLNDNGSFQQNDAFQPFSMGPRRCPGESMAQMMIFLFLTNILQNFNLKSVLAPHDIQIAAELNGTLPFNYQMYVTPR
ncbi:cytochrome P450 2C8-like [Anomaloglossus baeobatrachus]|uniref:cytochrome P450 2C8-like n=1 Tax=Anomaloglossus baeobatrachus TaxID=238106 RepID=UPI003F503984